MPRALHSTVAVAQSIAVARSETSITHSRSFSSRLIVLPSTQTARPREFSVEHSSLPAWSGQMESFHLPATSLRQVVPVTSFGLRIARHHPLAHRHIPHCLARNVWVKRITIVHSYLRHSHPSTAFESPADKELAPNTIPAAALVARLFMFFTTAVTLVGRLCPCFSGMSQAPAQA